MRWRRDDGDHRYTSTSYSASPSYSPKLIRRKISRSRARSDILDVQSSLERSGECARYGGRQRATWGCKGSDHSEFMGDGRGRLSCLYAKAAMSAPAYRDGSQLAQRWSRSIWLQIHRIPRSAIGMPLLGLFVATTRSGGSNSSKRTSVVKRLYEGQTSNVSTLSVGLSQRNKADPETRRFQIFGKDGA